MDRDYLKEKLTTYRTLLTLFWTGLFLLSGGLIHYHSDLTSTFRKIIFTTGIVFEVGLFFVVIIFLLEIKRLLKKIKESENV